jgi:solute carrier family 13 (sodium-dependent dicarboxylate transporter), member 2/3/5
LFTMTDDERKVSGRILSTQGREHPHWLKMAISVALGCAIAFIPEHAGLSDDGRTSLMILIIAAGLWITEAIPAFAVGLLVIGLQILLLGRDQGGWDSDQRDWEKYIATWGSPLIWLFFGGFVLSAAGEKTGLTLWLSDQVLRRMGRSPGRLLASCMGVTFAFSMFISNTAASVMMVTMVMPIIRSLPPKDRMRCGLLLGVSIGANLGGMGTIIGSPPNAIAAGALRQIHPIDFANWMWLGLPPALAMLVLSWFYLRWSYRSDSPSELSRPSPTGPAAGQQRSSAWQRILVMIVFGLTVLGWMTQSWHGIPVTVVSFLPICVFTAAQILDHHDVCKMRWDVLLLIAGGLSLGLAVTDTGLANWLVQRLPLSSLGSLGLGLVLAYLTVGLSNLMSNTAAANILVPIAVVAASGSEAQVVVPLVLSASAAMTLPISTPPNAVVFATEMVQTRDFIRTGILIGLIAPLLSVLWVYWII